MIHLAPMTAAYAETIRQWRNRDLRPWRTPFMLTEEMQREWYLKTVCNRQANSRHFALLTEDGSFVGQVVLTNICWEAGSAEIGLGINPEETGKHYGMEAVELILDVAFNQLRLQTVYGECYECNPAIGFWRKVAAQYKAYTTKLPRRKLWGGQLFDSLYFSLTREVWDA
jgi:RimJ/RimL family protein N-acetyltransferase